MVKVSLLPRIGQGLGSKRCHCASCWCSLGPCGHLAKQFFGLHRRLLAAGADSSDRRCGRISVSGGAPRRNGCAPGEIRKICDLANENHMFLKFRYHQSSIFGKNRWEFQSGSCHRQNSDKLAGRKAVAGTRWPAGRRLPEPGLG